MTINDALQQAAWPDRQASAATAAGPTVGDQWPQLC
jgi:hypothetical protein